MTGAGGMLARALVPELRARGHEVTALDRAGLEVTDAAAVRRVVRELRPAIAVQCAAYTAVDRAEQEEAAALAVNAAATGALAAACQEVGASIVYPSTDYVFAGTGARPYRVGDEVEPVNAYGRTKLAGERAAAAAERALVIRTSWLYGEGGPNFVDTIARLARERDRLEVVDDQIGRPTWTASLARTTAGLMEADARGVFHATDGGEPVSWYGLAGEVVRLLGIETELVPVTTAEFPRPAPRPAYSVLDCAETERRLGAPMPGWRDSLAAYLSGSGRG